MKSLQTLIKLHRQSLDEKRRLLAGLEIQRHSLEEAVTQLAAQVLNEQQVVEQYPETRVTYSQFLHYAKTRREELQLAIEQVTAKIIPAAEEVAELYGEVKKYEIALEQRQKEAAEKERLREQTQLDEIGMTIFLRQQEQETIALRTDENYKKGM